MSDLTPKVRQSPQDSSTRFTKTHIPRQSSITRPTKASETRSVRSKNSDYATPVATRQSSLRHPSRGTSVSHPSTGLQDMQYRPLSPSLPRPVQRLSRMDKSNSINDLATLSARPAHVKPSLYVSSKSASSHSLSTQTSPRRAGLGARTISPVEIKRSKRHSTVLESGLASAAKLPTHLNAARKVSGIPSPVKPPVLSRSRPSPVPPVPPLPQPDQFHATINRRTSPTRFKIATRSVSNPVSSQRQRSATVSASKQQSDATPLGHDKLSFTSPMKQSRVVSAATRTTGSHLQPLNLPPMKVRGLSTPTVRRVHKMSQALDYSDAAKIQPSDTAANDHERYNSAQEKIQAVPPEAALSNLALKDSRELDTSDSVDSVLQSMRTVSGENRRSDESTSVPKARDLNSFFGRLSLSRSSSRSKVKKKQSTDILEHGIESDGKEPTTPERRRRLSLSWMKGKMSPFGNSSSVPRYDPGTPPVIPKSFTSESLASQLSQNESIEATTQSKAAGETAEGIRPKSVTDNEDVASRPHSSRSRPTASEIADEEMRNLLIAAKGSRYLTEARTLVANLEAKAIVREPVEAAHITSLDGCPLNLYEKGEAIDYDGKIYFTGKRGLQKIGGRLDSALNINSGYDDDRGDYLINPGDHFAYRYEIVDVLGKGSFGQVLRCIDYKTGSLVAVKVIRNKQRFHAQALVEVKILKMLRQWVSRIVLITMARNLTDVN